MAAAERLWPAWVWQDEVSEDPDPLPSWIRAKKMIDANWPLMEQLAGSREQKMRSVQEFQNAVRPSLPPGQPCSASCESAPLESRLV